MKQLKKSKNKVFTGVCGGIAERLKIDPTIVRLIICILALFTNGIVVVLYIVAAFIMPADDEARDFSDEKVEKMKSANMNSEEEREFESRNSGSSDNKAAPHSTEEFNSFFDNK